MSKISAIMYAQLRRDDNDICRNRGSNVTIFKNSSSLNNDKPSNNRNVKSN